ncbi:MAG TPA: hypothetical protein VHN14_00460, partial [Kofleriaceae bacterium]|nr:hypothetical protein [Kofleriaceae bacterium]
PMLTLAPFIELSLLTMIALLVGRSALHVRAGVAGMRERHPDNTTAVVVKYSNFAVLAAAILCGVMFLMTLIESEGRMAGPAIFLMLITVVFALWGLTTWPVIIKRFFVDRQFADFLAHGEALPARAPDRGLTTLGWLLFGQAVLALTMALPVLLWSSPLDPDDYDRARDPMSQMFGAFQAGGTAQWWTIGAAALQLVASWQLIQMRPNHKRLVTLWGVAASLVAVYVNYPLLKVMIKGSLHGAFGGSQAMLNNLAFMMVAIALIVPIAALILVHRKHRELPTAVLHK